MKQQAYKRFRRRILERVLRVMAQAVLAKYHPILVGVTGSVGKSSTKEAIALILSAKYHVWKSEGNYNNEIGAPLTILGAAGGGSFLRWGLVGLRFVRLMLFPMRYPEVLVLEMGIDRPGDMEYLVSFLSLRIGVMTNIGPSHIQYFGSLNNIAREKGKIISNLPEDGYAILNADDERVRKLAERTKGKVMFYGFSEQAGVRADNLVFNGVQGESSGWSFKLNYEGKTIPVRLPQVLAKHHIEDALAACAVAVSLGMNLVDIASQLERMKPLPGRLRALPGKHGSILLDDTYNAAPASMEAALETMQTVRAMRKVTVLGDMLELGGESEASHRALAAKVQMAGVEYFIGVGQHIHATKDALIRAGFPERNTLLFPDAIAAASWIPDFVRQGDVILVKGSRGMRMEKISEALLAAPSMAKDALCSQSPEWRRKPFVPPEEWQK